MKYDFLIVGAGLNGCVLAERIASQLGKKVLVVDRRPYVGGLAHDYYNEDGILMQEHGLHLFHTSSQEIFDYVRQFSEWHFANSYICSYVDGKLIPMPLNIDSIKLLYGLDLNTAHEAREYFDSLKKKIKTPRNAEENAISKVGEDLYRKLFRGYTLKWWNTDASKLPPRFTSIITTRANHKREFLNDTYQGVPKHGFTRMFENMLKHKNIEVALNTDYRSLLDTVKFDRMIYSGAIDEFFDYQYGRLPYRSMRFEHETLDKEFYQPCLQVNYPNDHDYLRIFEYKHATGQQHKKTTIVKVYSEEATPEMERYYPIPLDENLRLAQKYKQAAAAMKSVLFIGQLVDYKYYTMSQTEAKAFSTLKKAVAV